VLIIEAIYQASQKIYAVKRRRTDGAVWNGVAFETYNQANWASYAIPLAEQSGSGYYFAASPNIGVNIATDTIYLQAGGSPALGDTAVNNLHNQGENIAAVNADVTGAQNLQAALDTETQGTVAAGSISVSSFPTSLTNSTNGAYQGLTIRFITGAAAGMAGLIANYSAAGGVITLAGSLAALPSANDTFIIV